MDQSASNQFRTALIHLLKQEGRGAQARLAENQGIDRGYLSAIVRGKKPGSEQIRNKIASHFGMVYEEILILGRRIMDGEESPVLGGEPDKQQEKAITHLADNSSDISTAIIEILGSDTSNAKLLTDLIEALHGKVTVERKCSELTTENEQLKEKIEEFEARIARLEEAGNCDEPRPLKKTA
ncbi:hypothetical protein [Desulfogranum marinum]|uniref:hypothetical protein n=1 Tax=Desulfogranum marinum TaxID=453220 RepID=UPI0029C6DFEC|nr:hypothetical protein [Desulfogranum marinum]